MSVFEELTNARTELEKIYAMYPEAIHSDNIMFYKYVLPLVYGVEEWWSFRHLSLFILKNNIHFESYRRMGQKIREEMASDGRFVRNPELTKRLEAEFLDYLRETR